MRSHSALYVDAGYLLAAAATRLTGSSFRRGVVVDYALLLTKLIAIVEDRTGLPILRVYWYDAARDGKPTPSQEHIALLSKVKLRLGRVGVEGEQKGVDLRIGLDMVGHSRNGAVDTMYLLSGDDDLTEAVEEAQAQGVQVVVLAVPSRSGERHGVSRHLMLAADDVEILDGATLDAVFTTPDPVTFVAPSHEISTESVSDPSAKRPTPADLARIAVSSNLPRLDSTLPETRDVETWVGSLAIQSGNAALDAAAIAQVARKTYDAWAAGATALQRDELIAGRPSIPRDLDRALLVDLSDQLGEYALSDPLRFKLRAEFWKAVDLSPAAPSAVD